MENLYEVFYGEDGKWGIWRFVFDFEDMQTAFDTAKTLNEGFDKHKLKIEAEGGENDTN
jgi:hypothetical protein